MSDLPYKPYIHTLDAYTPGEQINRAGIVKLNTNENPNPPSEKIREAILEAAGRLNRYPNPTSDSLRGILAEYHGIEPEQILVTNGSDEALRLLIALFVGPGDALAMLDPSYSLYPVLARQVQGVANLYPLIDRTALPEAFFQAPEPLLIIPNPNPPIGTLFSHEEIARLCDARSDRCIVADEAYVDFAPCDCFPLLSKFPNLAITRTFSKALALAGMRIGYVAASAEIISNLMKLKDSYNVNHLSQAAAIAAIRDAATMRNQCREICRIREETVARLRNMGFTIPESHGNFFFAIHPKAETIFQKLRERDILVRYFNVQPLLDGIRITVGTRSEMDRLISALETILPDPAS